MLTKEQKSKLFKFLENNKNKVKYQSTILCSTFYKKPDHTKKLQLRLYNSFVTKLKEDQNSSQKFMYLTFDVTFEILRQPNQNPKKEDKQKISKPIGIRFRADKHQTVQFFCDNVAQLEKWEHELAKRINQRGFHQLFKAMKKLGKGNFASVYLGERIKDKKQFAIKAFAKQATYSQQNGKQSVINQIKINRMFDHPNLMKIEGIFQSENSIYMILELIEGQQLVTKMQSRQKFSEQQVKTIMKGLLQGVAEMARKNVIHRDLKPQNIIFRKDGKQAVIVDFGLSTIADQKVYLFVRCGTPGYVAPQIINIKDMTTKSHPIADVFSLGAIFYTLLFNKYLFPGKNFNEILNQNRECEFVLSGPQFDGVPLASDLLRKMLQKQPQLRISAAEALRHPYFGEASKKAFVPKLGFRESGSCPTYLIDKKNQSNFKFIIKQQKSLLGKITELDLNIHSIKKTDVDKLLAAKS